MSVYKAVITTNNELMHFNKNHSKHNGQFISGDGDGDGVVDDHNNGKKSSLKPYKTMGISSAAYGHTDSKSKKYGAAQTMPKMLSKEEYKKKKQEQRDARKASNKRSSMFKSANFNEYKDEKGNVDTRAYTRSGVKKMLAGFGTMAVGKFLSNSDNLVASGAGYLAEYAGAFTLGYGTTQTVYGAYANAHKDNKK